MFAPQAIRTMVRVAVAVNMCAAMFTGKIFYLAIKFFHFFTPYRQVKRNILVWQEHFDETSFLIYNLKKGKSDG